MEKNIVYKLFMQALSTENNSAQQSICITCKLVWHCRNERCAIDCVTIYRCWFTKKSNNYRWCGTVKLIWFSHARQWKFWNHISVLHARRPKLLQQSLPFKATFFDFDKFSGEGHILQTPCPSPVWGTLLFVSPTPPQFIQLRVTSAIVLPNRKSWSARVCINQTVFMEKAFNIVAHISQFKSQTFTGLGHWVKDSDPRFQVCSCWFLMKKDWNEKWMPNRHFYRLSMHFSAYRA